MRELRYTLVCDGSSNECLLPILTWLIHELGVTLPVQEEWADLRRLRNPPRALPDRIRCAVDLYPCDLLFVHRDAETSSRQDRTREIERAVANAFPQSAPPFVCVVPVRMQEAWMLFDEQAIRTAAGNPNGTVPLDIPSACEGVPDPKAVLYEAMKRASGLAPRRFRGKSWARAAHRVTDLMDDFSPLRAFDAFSALEAELRHVVRQQGWMSLPAEASD